MSTDEDTETEEEELEDFGGDMEPPAPPPAPRQHAGSAQPPTPPPQEFLDLAAHIRSAPGRLAQGAMMFDILSASMADVLVDDTINPSDRRRELRTIAAAASKVFPLKELHEALAKIDAFNAQIERKASAVGAKLEDAPAIGRAKVIPIRGTAVPTS